MNLMILKMNLYAKNDDKQYWFSQDKMELITKIHDYLEIFQKLEKFNH
jgi:hypothetical protein